MHIRYIVGAMLVSVFTKGTLPLPPLTPSRLGTLVAPTAEAQKLREKARSLLDRVLGKDMPDGIVKTNGRIEATQVDVAAKYPGRLVESLEVDGNRADGRAGNLALPGRCADVGGVEARDRAGVGVEEI